MKPDGGPAFPAGEIAVGPNGLSRQDGMSLRDYFAAAALVECIRVAADNTPGDDHKLTELFDKAAAYAYYAADAMLAQREKP